MSAFLSLLGTAIALAGGDKLVGNRSYAGMFRHLGWTKDEMRALAVAEMAGGLMMTATPTRRIGGAVVTLASTAVLASEIHKGDSKLAGPRGLVLLAGLAALLLRK